MNPERLFKEAPPREPLTTIAAVVRDWQWRFGKEGAANKYRDHVVDHCRNAKNLRTAIQRACDCRDANGKMHNHQTRVRKVCREELRKSLQARRVSDLLRAKDFDDIYDIVEEEAKWGIGPVTIYDIATRIAAFLKIEPESLYLHAGVLKGWCLLTGSKPREWRHTKRIERHHLPPDLRKLPPDEVEDLLCAYRGVFEKQGAML